MYRGRYKAAMTGPCLAAGAMPERLEYSDGAEHQVLTPLRQDLLRELCEGRRQTVQYHLKTRMADFCIFRGM